MNTLLIMRNPSDSDSYIAEYSDDEGNEAHDLARGGTLNDAIEAALNVWGLTESDIHITASN